MRRIITLFIILAVVANLKADCQNYGKTIQLNGTTDYVNIGNMGTFPMQGSITFWIKPTDLGSYRNVLSTGGIGGCGGGNNSVRFEVNGGTFVGAIGETGGCNTAGGLYTASMATNVQYHIVLTWNQTANNIKGYLNGNLVFNQAHTLWNATFNDVKIGVGWSIDRKWQGFIDEVTFWNKEVTAAEVINIKNNNIPISDPNLIAYYSFNNNNVNGQSQVVPNDRNPGTYNGVTVGTPTTPIFTPSFVLPVELVNFKGQIINNTVLLNWQTASEHNSKGFAIERSTDGSNYASIGYVNAKGNSTNETNYSFIDNQIIKGKLFYRLRQEDLDGNKKISSVVKLEIKDLSKIKILSNPVTDLLKISSQNTMIKITIVNMHGQILLVHKTNLSSVTLPVEQLQPGLYEVQVESMDGSTDRARVIKQ